MTCEPCAIRARCPSSGRTNANCWHCKVHDLASGPEAHQAFMAGKTEKLSARLRRQFPAPLWAWAAEQVRAHRSKRV
jgi:hypothetical protein